MRHLHLRGNGDPFTLLKILQAVRDLQADEQLEIRCDRAEPLAELLRLLPADRCRVAMGSETGDGPGRCLHLTGTGAPAVPPDDPPKPNPTEDTPRCGNCCNR